MNTNTRNERGGALLELTIMAFVLTAFLVGAVGIHHALGARFTRIVRDRNDRIARIRR